MRVFVLTLGTRGDLEIFLALARALARRGHAVELACSGFHRERVAEAGIDCVPLGDAGPERLASLLRSFESEPDGLRRTRRFYDEWLAPELAAAQQVIGRRAGAADYFVSNLKLVARRGESALPGALVTYDPPLSTDDLPRYAAAACPGAVLDLVALPRELVDPDGRFGPGFRFTGFWREETRFARALAPALEAFLGEGEPPVAITLGSMASFDPAALLSRLESALASAGLRGVAVRGWSELPLGPFASGRLLVVDEAPYASLFARACCVVHHGGTGTVAAALAAGRPSVLLPQIACQSRFAALLMRAGVVTGVFDTTALDERALARALERATRDEGVRERARHWQRVVSAERGVESACDAIEAHASSVGVRGA
jgi:sterol 3beta-glucosyltransferase